MKKGANIPIFGSYFGSSVLLQGMKEVLRRVEMKVKRKNSKVAEDWRGAGGAKKKKGKGNVME